jgi:hypothetical protein
MKVNITRVLGGSNPEVTIFHYTRARWDRKSVVLSGIAKCGNKCWNIVHTYYVPSSWQNLPKEAILGKLFNF